MSAPQIEAALRGILKRFDRIGFGRRGVLDAEHDILRFASGLSTDDHASLTGIVISWIGLDEATRVTASLQYNLPEHLQALGIRLCASLPITDSLPRLRRLQADGAFGFDDTPLCVTALHESVRRLTHAAGLG
jgi:hypothetical protein